MFKIYQKYLVKSFINKFLTLSLIFISLVIILSVLEEISFFKNINTNFLLPYFLTILGSPITLFEIFPFIFLLSTQFLFYDLFKKEELNLLKSNGLSNLKVIKTLFLTSFLIGIFTVLFFYNIASKLKFIYTDIKNWSRFFVKNTVGIDLGIDISKINTFTICNDFTTDLLKFF